MTSSSQQRRQQLLAAASGRDRVLDAVKALALLVVVLGHSTAWDVSTGAPSSVLDQRPQFVWMTWGFQVLPVFFAAGAVTNLSSWRRRPQPAQFVQRRLLRLAAPALVYTAVWTLLLLPLTLVLSEAVLAGHFLSQLLWFLGAYTAVVVAVPLTARWTGHPAATLGLWLAAIVLVDVLRWTVAPVVGWLNMLLVWGWLHQVGYHLPALRRWPRGHLLALAAASLGAAVALGIAGPYSTSLVTYAGDPEPSNLAPPTLVVALYGLAQVLVLAMVWVWLERVLAHDRVWLPVVLFGTREIEIYLWHIPAVAVVAVTAWQLGFAAEPFDAAWSLAHAAGFLVIITLAWWTAGLVARAQRSLSAWGRRQPRRALPLPTVAIVVPMVLLSITTTGFATWWGGVLGPPSSSLLNLAVLAAAWWALACRQADA